MTIQEAIQKVDALKPNTYSLSEKVAWLSTLDLMIKKFVLDTHDEMTIEEREAEKLKAYIPQRMEVITEEDETEEKAEFTGYTDETPLSTKLLVDAPFDDIYLSWLEAKIDFYNGEYTKYNNSIMRHNEVYRMFSNHYNSTHMAKGKKIRFF